MAPEWLTSWAGTAWDGLALAVPLGLTLGYLLLFELLLPRRDAPQPSLRSRAKALMFWVVYGVTSALLMRAILPAYAALHIHPLLPSLEPAGLPRPLALIVACIAGGLIGDFVYYWCHRFQHRFLWRFHAVHHSVREMSVLTAYHHFTEPLMKTVLYLTPVTLITPDPFSASTIGVLLALQGHYLHSSTRVNFGPLGAFIQDNRFHRIHHSIRPEHHDKNFAVFTTLWDRVFGTAYFPAPGEWPETGVADFPEPSNLKEYFLAPFTWRAGAASKAPALVAAAEGSRCVGFH